MSRQNKALLVVLAALCLVLPASPVHAEKSSSGLAGMWTTSAELEDGTQGTNLLCLRSNGRFDFLQISAGREVQKEFEGTYNYRDGVLTLTGDGGDTLRLKMRIGGDKMTTKLDDKPVIWTRRDRDLHVTKDRAEVVLKPE